MRWLDKLGLRPQEKRWVVGAAAIVFVVLNAWFVYPHFKDWGLLQNDLMKARRTLNLYRAEAAKAPANEKVLRELESAGSAVLPADQSIHLLRTVQEQAQKSGVLISQTYPVSSAGGRTNEFFEEQSVRLRTSTGDEELVDFLYSLGSTNSLIRVRELDVRPEQPAQVRLVADVTLVASYQRKAPPAAAKPSATNAPAAVASAPARATNAPATKTISTNTPAKPGNLPRFTKGAAATNSPGKKP